jgi:predicted dehydrogenase
MAICTTSEQNLRKKAEQFHISSFYTYYREMLKSSDIDTVIIVVPNYLHMEVCIASLKAGKRVLCEKPPALNASDAELM